MTITITLVKFLSLFNFLFTANLVRDVFTQNTAISQLIDPIFPSGTIFRPFNINQQEDIMCFAIYVPPASSLPVEITNLFSFSFSLPSTLKIESHVYDYLNAPDIYVLSPSMVISFLVNSSMSDSFDLGIGSNIYTTVQSLASYPTQLFEDFFWTSSTINKFFEFSATNDSSGNKDHDTVALWRSLASVLIGSNLNVSSDPCGFKTLVVENHIVSHFIVINYYYIPCIYFMMI